MEVAVAVELTTAPSAMGVALAVLVGSNMVHVDMKMGGVVVSGIELIANCRNLNKLGQPRRYASQRRYRQSKTETCGKQC